MYVKRISDKKIQDVLQLAWRVFEEEVADTYSEEGVEEFRNFIKYENMIPQVESREIEFFKVLEGEELCGMSAIRKDGHICLLFVKKEWQKKGAARKLFYAMQQYCVIERRLQQMTVNATPHSVAAYQRLGFTITRPEQEVNGIRSVAMTYLIKDAREIVGGVISSKRKHMMRLISILAIIALFVVNYFGAKTLFEDMSNESQFKDESGQTIEENPKEEYNSEEVEELAGIEGIHCYIQEELSYVIKEEVYTLQSGANAGTYQMEFNVKYPQIEGLESEKAIEINQILKDCAMSTVNVLYLEPDESIKEAMIKQKDPVLMSTVNYKISYATEDFISVVYEDYYIAGDSKKGYADLRTRNISLKDGICYEVKDVVSLSSNFMSDWRIRMNKENPSSVALRELKTSEFRKILNGQVLEGNYHDAFFVEEGGMQIGLTYHYTNNSGMENGWTTAPFTMEELKEYRLQTDFWKLFE